MSAKNIFFIYLHLNDDSKQLIKTVNVVKNNSNNQCIQGIVENSSEAMGVTSLRQYCRTR